MKRAFALTAVLLIAAATPAVAGEDPHRSSAEAYEHLANAIIAIRATEDALVAGILSHHYAAALDELRAAVSMNMTKPHVKAAADQITAIANEGDKAVQAIRQRLLQAGHHHHTDAETEEDYIWIDSKEKKALLDLAGKVARLDKVSDVDARIEELTRTFRAAMKPE